MTRHLIVGRLGPSDRTRIPKAADEQMTQLAFGPADGLAFGIGHALDDLRKLGLHASRLGRDLKNRFGTAAYAAEELVAELSSAMLGAELGLPVTHLDSHASYIEHWLKLLKDDDRAILTAAAKAEEASTLLLKLGGRVTPEQFDDASDDAALAA